MKAFSRVVFSSMADEWNTPQTVYEQLDKEFHFNHDPCPSKGKADGLTSKWKKRNFINPPFSQVAASVQKGYKESLQGKLCVFLVAARTDTIWFHTYALPHAKEIRFIRQTQIWKQQELCTFPILRDNL
jgi:hypothetical protein